jgi:hypothetical protein
LYAVPSRAHSKVRSAAGVRLSEPVNSKVATLFGSTERGPSVTEVFGATWSGPSWTFHTYEAGCSSTTPSGLVARTRNSCSPFSTTQYAAGEVQRRKSAPSSEHSNVDPGWSAPKTKTAFSLVLGGCGGVPSSTRPAGPELMLVTGAATTVQLRVAGVGSAFPARSIARTRSVCSPGSRPCTDSGDWHGSNGRLSTEHSKVSDSSGVAKWSLPVNTKSAGVSSPILAGGPERISVDGAAVSAVIVHVWTAGGPTLPSTGAFGSSGSVSSMARTSNLWGPGASSASW